MEFRSIVNFMVMYHFLKFLRSCYFFNLCKKGRRFDVDKSLYWKGICFYNQRYLWGLRFICYKTISMIYWNKKMITQRLVNRWWKSFRKWFLLWYSLQWWFTLLWRVFWLNLFLIEILMIRLFQVMGYENHEISKMYWYAIALIVIMALFVIWLQPKNFVYDGFYKIYRLCANFPFLFLLSDYRLMYLLVWF